MALPLFGGHEKNILTFVMECDIFERNKGEIVKTPRALYPFTIPTSIWIDISMDFIVGLPTSDNKLVVNRLSKYAHLFALQHPFTTAKVAQVFIEWIFKIHGMPTSIIFDHDPTFTIKLWKELFKLQGTQLKMSTSYHR